MEISFNDGTAAGRMEVLPGYLWESKRKPLLIHRLMMRLFFGWKWTDKE